jgi:hypothetical protein
MKTKYAKDGMWLMNEDIIVKSVNLPDNADPSVWVEVTEKEKTKIEEKLENNY